MTIITAAAAKAISNDVISNDCSKKIETWSNAILQAASEGRDSVSIPWSKDRGWGYSGECTEKSFRFLRELGYKIDTSGWPCYFRIQW